MQLGRVGAAQTAEARRLPEIPILGVPLQLVMCVSAGFLGHLCLGLYWWGSTRIRGAAWMLFPIEAPPVGCSLVPMSNPEDGVDDALFAEPSIDKRLVPAMNGSRRERCQQYRGDETCAGGSGGEGPWKAELGREPATRDELIGFKTVRVDLKL